ncbi:hypothetical protein AGLY_007563 [Aphis glycines]|uniref:Uncharacterized protein n=1 Tax=Aphis glycines TaxID=307491 RepID=A0A6G0TMD6_APHGL|nr:hypothetical protein AGLY_007563 [Aphis glycines]
MQTAYTLHTALKSPLRILDFFLTTIRTTYKKSCTKFLRFLGTQHFLLTLQKKKNLNISVVLLLTVNVPLKSKGNGKALEIVLLENKLVGKMSSLAQVKRLGKLMYFIISYHFLDQVQLIDQLHPMSFLYMMMMINWAPKPSYTQDNENLFESTEGSQIRGNQRPKKRSTSNLKEFEENLFGTITRSLEFRIQIEKEAIEDQHRLFFKSVVANIPIPQRIYFDSRCQLNPPNNYQTLPFTQHPFGLQQLLLHLNNHFQQFHNPFRITIPKRMSDVQFNNQNQNINYSMDTSSTFTNSHHFSLDVESNTPRNYNLISYINDYTPSDMRQLTSAYKKKLKLVNKSENKQCMASVSCETMRHFCTMYRDSCVQPQSVPCERARIIARHQDERRIEKRNSSCFSQELE